MGLFDRQKEKRELNRQDRASRKEAGAAAREVRDTWLQKADELAQTHSAAIEAAASVDIEQVQRTAERMRRITAEGVQGRATVISARACGQGMGGVGTAIELDLDLTEGPGAPRVLRIRQDVLGGPETYPAGLEVPVKVDPGSPDDAMVWSDSGSSGEAGASALSPDDRTSRLEAIANLRDQGVITEQQFQQFKSQLLADG